MKRINKFSRLLIALALILLITVPTVWACDDAADCEDYKPDLKQFIQMACNVDECGDHHIDVRGLMKLACMDPDDCEDCRKDLKGLLQLACDANTGEDCDYAPDLKKLKQLACDLSTGIDCDYRPDLNGLMQLACDANSGDDCDYRPDLDGLNHVASAPKKKLAFMGIPNNVSPAARGEELERRLSSKTPSFEQAAMARIQGADPKDFPVLMGFLKKRIPVDAKDKLGNTLLFYFAAKGDLNAVKYLLEKGADPKCKNNGGCTPLSCAKAKAHKKIEKLMWLADKNEDGNLGSDRVPVGSPIDR